MEERANLGFQEFFRGMLRVGGMTEQSFEEFVRLMIAWLIKGIQMDFGISQRVFGIPVSRGQFMMGWQGGMRLSSGSYGILVLVSGCIFLLTVVNYLRTRNLWRGRIVMFLKVICMQNLKMACMQTLKVTCMQTLKVTCMQTLKVTCKP